jgi:hypothetical protein
MAIWGYTVTSNLGISWRPWSIRVSTQHWKIPRLSETEGFQKSTWPGDFLQEILSRWLWSSSSTWRRGARDSPRFPRGSKSTFIQKQLLPVLGRYWDFIDHTFFSSNCNPQLGWKSQFSRVNLGGVGWFYNNSGGESFQYPVFFWLNVVV